MIWPLSLAKGFAHCCELYLEVMDRSNGQRLVDRGGHSVLSAPEHLPHLQPVQNVWAHPHWCPGPPWAGADISLDCFSFHNLLICKVLSDLPPDEQPGRHAVLKVQSTPGRGATIKLRPSSSYSAQL